jgi:hypothetical protein
MSKPMRKNKRAPGNGYRGFRGIIAFLSSFGEKKRERGL